MNTFKITVKTIESNNYEFEVNENVRQKQNKTKHNLIELNYILN